MNRAFFFDRDGIVNVLLDNDYVKRIEEFVFVPQFFEIFNYAKKMDYLTFVITNQQGIGKGVMNDEDVRIVHRWMQRRLLEYTGYQFDDIYYCGSLDAANSPRRKPASGMFFEAISQYGIDPAKSFMIGDSLRDSQSAKGAGVNSILIGEFAKEDADYVFLDFHSFLLLMDKIVK